jgi:Ca-activated chloride channel family protein
MNNPAMKQILILLTTLSVAPFARAEFHWSNLWQTPDQRGDTLLHQGHAAEAAQTYSDPRRKAYAELKAGKYADAAHDLEPFKDSDALYNRGNALAHTGDLEGALKAYDTALTRDPKNNDARHNRDLVAKELKKQQQQQKNQPQKKPSSFNPDNKNQGNQGNQGKSMQNSPANGQDKNQQKTDQDKPSDSAHSKQNGSTQPSGSKASDQKGQNQSPSNSPNTSPNSNAPDSKQTSEKSTRSNPSAKTQTPQERAASAQRDAEAGLKSAQADQQKGQNQAQGNTASLNLAPRKSVSNTTQDEQKIAEQQWLKNIPDSPEGLLQRKFLIEHLMRQQEQKTQP